MPRYLSERKVWLKMAELWKNARQFDWGQRYCVSRRQKRICGLCDTLTYCIGKVRPSVENAIRAKIKAHRGPLGHWPFKWSHGAYGRTARIRFCLQQAEFARRVACGGTKVKL